MNWQIGDRAILINSLHGVHLNHVVDILGSHILIFHNDTWPAGTSGYHIMCCGHKYFCTSDWLRPIPDNNSRQVTTWDECPFTPKELVAA